MASTTVETFITDARYDIDDPGGAKYDDTYLVNMINRGIRILERELIASGSDLTVDTTTATLSAAANSINLSKTVDNIRRVYISTEELYFVPLETLYRYRIEVITTNTGTPEYYSTWGKPSTSDGRKLLFDYTADQEYTVSYVYDKLTGNLSLTDYMPFDDMFNDYIREGMVILCRKAKETMMYPTDRLWREMFRNYMFQAMLASNRTKKYYKVDF